MRFRVLGPLEVEADGRPVATGGGRQRALLGLLLTQAGEVVSRDRLIEELWHGAPPASAGQSLDSYLSRLRRALREAGGGDELQTRAPGYRLRAEDTDAREFEALVAAGRESGDPGVLREALALWRGPAYQEVAEETWARAEAARLEDLRLAATEALLEAELANGCHAGLVPELERLAALHPTRERLAGQLMLALYRCGRQADALAAYAAARHALAEQLGLEPGPELQALQTAVLSHDPALGRVAPRRERRRRRPALLAAAATVLAAGAAALLVSGGDAGAPRAIAADGAGVVDPASGRVVASVPVGSAPAAIAVAAGRVWVANGADGTVSRIDPEAPHVEQTVSVGSSPAAIAAGGGAIWVANALSGTVSRIDPRAGRVVQTVRAGRRPQAAVAVGGRLWVADADGAALVALDLRTGARRGRIGLHGSPAGVAAADGSLWVSEPLARRLLRIDPRSREVIAEIPVGGGAGPVVGAGGVVWVLNVLDGTLSRVDPARNAVASTLAIGDTPTGAAADGNGVWVTDRAGELVSVTPAGAIRRRYDVGAAPVGVALVGGRPWVAVGAPTGRQHRGGTLRVRYATISSLDPVFGTDVHPAIWRATGDTLLSLEGSELVPDLALAVPLPTRGGRSYRFQLRPGLRYSNGGPVRASDIRRAFERLWTLQSPSGGQYDALAGAQSCSAAVCDLSHGIVTDDRAGTVTFELARRDPDWLSKLTLSVVRPVPPGTPAREPATSIPSTGPYRVARLRDRQLLLVRNPYFREWSAAAQPDGYPDRIDIRMEDDPARRAAAVLAGDADVALEIAGAGLEPLLTRHASQVRIHTLPGTSFVNFNVRRPPFDDVRARRALNLALDRRAVARRVGGGRLSAPACQVLPPHFPGRRDHCPWTRHAGDGRWHGPDLRRARALVRASGTRGARVVLVATGTHAAWPAVRAALQALGYRPRAVTGGSAFSARIGDPHGDWNLSDGEWIADYASPRPFLEQFLACSSYRPDVPVLTTNSGGFCDARFDRLVARAERMEPMAAERMWARADRRAVDRAAWLPLVNPGAADLLSTRTRHFTLAADGLVALDQLWVR
jgi:YVTN family beta-propeller protein